jgi:hypothetical protein
MLNSIRDILRDLVSSDHEQDWEDVEENEEDTELGKFSDDVEPCWVMGTIKKTVQHRMDSFPQKQMRLDELTQPGRRNAVNYFCERDMKYGTAKLKVPAIVKPYIDMTADKPSPTTVEEYMRTLEIV